MIMMTMMMLINGNEKPVQSGSFPDLDNWSSQREDCFRVSLFLERKSTCEHKFLNMEKESLLHTEGVMYGGKDSDSNLT